MIAWLTEENIKLKKVPMGNLNNPESSSGWVEPDIRDNVVKTVITYKRLTEILIRRLLLFTGLSAGKFYDWQGGMVFQINIINRYEGTLTYPMSMCWVVFCFWLRLLMVISVRLCSMICGRVCRGDSIAACL